MQSRSSSGKTKTIICWRFLALINKSTVDKRTHTRVVSGKTRYIPVMVHDQ
ncbi:MAG: hypothetical protein WC379_11530 [Methanoregula sp.]